MSLLRIGSSHTLSTDAAEMKMFQATFNFCLKKYQIIILSLSLQLWTLPL